MCADTQEVLDAGRAEHHVLRLRNRVLHLQATPPLPRVRPGVLLEVRGPLSQQPPNRFSFLVLALAYNCGPHWPMVSCSAQSLPGEQFGYLGPVRVCNYCYNLHNTVPCVVFLYLPWASLPWPNDPETDTCYQGSAAAAGTPERREKKGIHRAQTLHNMRDSKEVHSVTHLVPLSLLVANVHILQ